MIDGSNGLTSWRFVRENKLTMFWAHFPLPGPVQLAKTKVKKKILLLWML
jgi:hypothetical protein